MWRYSGWINIRRLALLALLISLPGCAPLRQPTSVDADNQPPGFPSGDYLRAVQRGKPVYRIDPSQSQVIILIYRGGKLAHLGHDHVAISRNLGGFVMLSENKADARADIYMPLKSLSLDEPALRKRYGLTSTLSDGDVVNTGHNMLTKVLRADQFPFVELKVKSQSGMLTPLKARSAVSVMFTLNGESVQKTLDVSVAQESAGWRFRGTFFVEQSEFDITPFTALGGLLTVQDRLDIEFDIAVVPEIAK
jgi:YceI-like domain